MVLHEWLAFYSAFFVCFCFIYPPKLCTYSAGMAGATWTCSRLNASSVYTIQPCTMSHHAKPHIGKVYACLAVTCHLHFWWCGQDLLRATALTRGWNGYRNKSQPQKVDPGQKKILPLLLQGYEPATFQSRVRRSNHWAIPASDYEFSQGHGMPCVFFLTRDNEDILIDWK